MAKRHRLLPVQCKSLSKMLCNEVWKEQSKRKRPGLGLDWNEGLTNYSPYDFFCFGMFYYLCHLCISFSVSVLAYFILRIWQSSCSTKFNKFLFFSKSRWKFSPQFANKNTILIIFDGHFSFKWANPGLFFFGCMDTFAKIKKCAIPGLCFCLFSSFSRYNFNTNWKKCRWCAWDSNPWPQDGRRRWNHGASAATLCSISHSINCFGQIKGKIAALWAGALSPIL